MAERRFWLLLGLITLAALALRLFVVLNAAFDWDEEREWIPMALSISAQPGNLHLPIRSHNHGAFNAYLIWLFSPLTDIAHLKFRLASLVLGTATIPLAGMMGRQFQGAACGLFAAALLAFNEYHIGVSSAALQLSPHDFFSALAILLFAMAIAKDRPALLLWCAFAAGLSFLAYELAALLVPAFGLVLLYRPNWKWFRRWRLYAAGTIGVLVIAPDVVANLFPSTPSQDYGDLLDRAGRPGFDPAYLTFFSRELMTWGHRLLLSREWTDPLTGFAAMNFVFGLMLIASAIACIVLMFREKDPTRKSQYLLHLGVFWAVLGIFSAIEPSPWAPGDTSLWIWVGVIMIPGAVLAGCLATRNRVLLAAGAVLLAIGAALSVHGVATRNLDFKRVHAVASPVLIRAEPGAYVDAKAWFDVCDVCRLEDPPVLTAVRSYPSTPGDIVDAAIGTPDVEMRLRADRGRGWKRYELAYDVRLKDGWRGEVVPVARVPDGDRHAYAEPFWVIERAATEGGPP